MVVISRVFICLCFCVLLGPANTFAIQKDQEGLPRPEAFEYRDYSSNRAEGFGIAMKLINRAEKGDAAPAIIARLRYQAAKLKRMMTLNDRTESEKDFSASIRMLRGVTRHPDRFLVDKDSAAWYRNCVSLLTAVYGDRGDSSELIEEELKVTMKYVADSENLDEELRFRTICDIRMAGSDVALRSDDWETAIEWVQPIIDSADRFLDNDGAYRIAMSTRQQSMFLANARKMDESSKLIDSICEKLDSAEAIDEYLRLSMQCMLRGKHLINFKPSIHDPSYQLAGWKEYEELSERVVAYQGSDQAKLLGSYTNMRRLANYVIKDADESIKNVRHVMDLIKAEPSAQATDSSVWFNLNDMYQSTMGVLTNNGDPRRQEFSEEVKAFIKEYRKQ